VLHAKFASQRSCSLLPYSTAPAPRWPANDVRVYVLNSRFFLKNLSGNLKSIHNAWRSREVFDPDIYVARLTNLLSGIHTFQIMNRKMDVILAAPSYIQERGMTETEIELWGFASKSRNLFSDLVKRLDAAVKSNRAYPDASPPELIWTVVMSVITDIKKFLRETD
jgi:hypothetical protein